VVRIVLIALVVIGLVTVVRLLKTFWSERARSASGGVNAPPEGPRMSRREALDVLGLGEGASRDEILASYRELIRKLHPDTGGSAYLAAKLNQARDVLLR
jgi:hypothetical protein